LPTRPFASSNFTAITFVPSTTASIADSGKTTATANARISVQVGHAVIDVFSTREIETNVFAARIGTEC
jgi:hypothetical protein